VPVPLIAVLAALGAVGWYLYDPDKSRAALEARWAPHPSQFIDALGLRLHVRDTGPREAPAVLLLHGFGASLHTWEDWAPLLEDRFRLIRLDLPGFGLTGPDPSRDYSDVRAVAVIAALLDALGVERASVVGSSMGGRIAWRFAAAMPERVERLVLMAPDGFASHGRAYGKSPRLPPLLRILPYSLPRPLLRRATAPAYADPAMLTDALIERYRDMLLAPGVRRAILDQVGQAVLVDPEPLLRRISAPVLLLWGERDRAVPVGHASDYLRVLADARLEVLPGIGHVPMEEAPEASAAALRRFLDPGR
jgi:pimeloyl-ACP methyl ester carboxylesterase